MKRTRRWIALILAITLVCSNAVYQLGTSMSASEVSTEDSEAQQAEAAKKAEEEAQKKAEAAKKAEEEAKKEAEEKAKKEAEEKAKKEAEEKAKKADEEAKKAEAAKEESSNEDKDVDVQVTQEPATTGETGGNSQTPANNSNGDTSKRENNQTKEYTVTIKLDDNDGIESVKLNDKNISYEDGKYTLKVENGKDITAKVTLKDGYENAVLKNSEGKTKYSTVNGNIYTYELGKIDNRDKNYTLTYSQVETVSEKEPETQSGNPTGDNPTVSTDQKTEDGDDSDPAKKTEAETDGTEGNTDADDTDSNKANDQAAEENVSGGATEPVEEETDEAEEETAYPADTVTVTAAGATITVSAPEGALPEGFTVSAEKVSGSAIKAAVEDAFEAEGKELVSYKAYDITIKKADGSETQPRKDVTVKISTGESSLGTKEIFHISDGEAESINAVSLGGTSTFAAEHFSIYGIMVGRIENLFADKTNGNGTSTTDASTDTITMTVGETYTLEPEITYTQNNPLGESETKTASGTFTSANKSIATVEGDSGGSWRDYTSATVTGKAAGETTITFSHTTGWNTKPKTATYTVKVNAATGISISGNDSMTVGKEIALTAAPTGLSENPTITWTSSNEAIATVDANGKVTAVANGEVTITATATLSDGTTYTATKTITVNPKEQAAGTTRVYLYVKVSADSGSISVNDNTLTQNRNSNGWYTVGCIDVPTTKLALASNKTVGDTAEISDISSYITSSNVTWFTTNQAVMQSIFSQINWNSLKVENGGEDYVAFGTNAWHLDGSIELVNHNITLTAASDEYTYDGTKKSVSGLEKSSSYTVNSDGSISFTDGDYTIKITGVTTTGATGTNVGTYTNTINVSNISYTVYDSNDNVVTNAGTVKVTGENGTLTIKKRAVTITGETATKKYNGSEQSITNTTESGLVSGHTYTASYSASGTYPGKYGGAFSGDVIIKDAEGNDVTSNYNITTTPGTLTIIKKSLKVEKELTNSGSGENETFKVGDVAKFTITVTNNGNVTLTGVTVTDSLIPNWSATIGSLEPDAVETFKVKYTVTQADVDGGSLTNVATAKDRDGTQDENDPTPVPTGEREARLTINKTVTSTPANGTAYQPGETITYRITATNTGNVTLTGGKVSDALTGDTWTLGTLRPGDDQVFTATHVVTEAEAAAGSVTNMATAADVKGPEGTTPAVDDGQVTTPTTPTPVPDDGDDDDNDGGGDDGDNPAAVVAAVAGAPAQIVDAINDVVVAVQRMVTNDDEEVPLANNELDHACCIFHFLEMLLALIILMIYTNRAKKKQQKIHELREELDTELAERGLPLYGERYNDNEQTAPQGVPTGAKAGK